MASVHILFDTNDVGVFEDRRFDWLPRVGETIIFSMGAGTGRQGSGLARCIVTVVEHDLRTGHSDFSVSAFVTVKPQSADDLAILRRLYPGYAFEAPESEPTA